MKKLAGIIAAYKVNRLKDFSTLENALLKKKKKHVKVTREDALSVYSYIYTGLLLELFILFVISIIAIILNIIIPTIAILIPFLVFRFIFKGNHLNGYYRCLIFTTSYIILAAFISSLIIPASLNLLLKFICYVSIGLGLELISLTSWFNKILDQINRFNINKT
jgi:accessory gene regulator protein AgrB